MERDVELPHEIHELVFGSSSGDEAPAISGADCGHYDTDDIMSCLRVADLAADHARGELYQCMDVVGDEAGAIALKLAEIRDCDVVVNVLLWLCHRAVVRFDEEALPLRLRQRIAGASKLEAVTAMQCHVDHAMNEYANDCDDEDAYYDLSIAESDMQQMWDRLEPHWLRLHGQSLRVPEIVTQFGGGEDYVAVAIEHAKDYAERRETLAHEVWADLYPAKKKPRKPSAAKKATA